MEMIFLSVLNMSVSAGWFILAVLVFRLLLKKAPRYISCVLWGLVGLRMVLPFRLQSVLSLIPSAQTVPEDIIYAEQPTVHTGFDVVDNVINPSVAQSLEPAAGASVNPVQIYLFIGAMLWTAGIAAMAVYGTVSWLLLRKKTSAAVKLHGSVWICDDIDSPFILGIIRPRIFIPSHIAEKTLASIEAHELAHLARRDHWWKPLGYALLTIHWFNPLAWLGYALFCRDIEAACDQRVIREMDMNGRKDYSSALLSCSTTHHSAAACPLAFGETGVKERVRSVLNYRKPALWLITAAAALCVIAALCFLTDPVTSVESELEHFISQTILEHERSSHIGDNFACEEHDIIGVERKGAQTTVYMLVMYNEYSCEEGVITCETGSHIPTAVTVTRTDSGYVLEEYWQSKDGTYYVPSIREKFPWYIEDKAIRIHNASDRHQAGCIAQAEAHFGVQYIDPFSDTDWTTHAVTAQNQTAPTSTYHSADASPDLGDITGMNIGAQMPSILWGDGRTFLLSGTFGLLMYDTVKSAVMHRLSCAELEQLGAELWYASAAADGTKVYIFTASASGGELTHILHIPQYTVTAVESTTMDRLFPYTELTAEHRALIDEYAAGSHLLGESIVDTGSGFWYLRADTDWSMDSLELVYREYHSGTVQVRRIFYTVERQVPNLASFILDGVSASLTGFTLGDLTRAWGEPDSSCDKPLSASWTAGKSGCTLTVYFEEGSMLVTDTRIDRS